MTFSENLMGLTDMKKIAAIVACLSGAMSQTAWAGTTILTGTPQYTGNKLEFHVECSGRGPISSMCGLWLQGFTNGDWFTGMGYCTGTGGYKPTSTVRLGGAPSGGWVGCGWTLNTNETGEWTLSGDMTVLLTAKGMKHFQDRTLEFAPALDGATIYGGEVRVTGTLPDGSSITETYSRNGGGKPIGTRKSYSANTWGDGTTTKSVRLEYPDELKIMGPTTATLMESSHPVNVLATTDLQNIEIQNDYGYNVLGKETVVLKKLTVKAKETNKGVAQGIIQLDVSLK